MIEDGKKFAVFDIDGTLIRWQLFHAIVHHLGKQGYISADTHQAIHTARMQWKNRNNDDSFHAYELTVVHAYKAALPTIAPHEYLTIVDAVFEEYKDQLFVYTRELLAELKEKGYFLLAISGSQDEIIQKLASYHGFDAAIGATLSIKDGTYTGEIISPIFNKDSTLKELTSKYNLTFTDSIGVGDTASDAAILNMVDHPIAFNPSKELFDISEANRWDIVTERKNVVYKLKWHNDGYVLASNKEM